MLHYYPVPAQIPTQLFDHVLPHVTPAEFKVIAYVVYRIANYRLDELRISDSELAQATGLSVRSVLPILARLARRGHLQFVLARHMLTITIPFNGVAGRGAARAGGGVRYASMRYV